MERMSEEADWRGRPRGRTSCSRRPADRPPAELACSRRHPAGAGFKLTLGSALQQAVATTDTHPKGFHTLRRHLSSFGSAGFILVLLRTSWQKEGVDRQRRRGRERSRCHRARARPAPKGKGRAPRTEGHRRRRRAVFHARRSNKRRREIRQMVQINFAVSKPSRRGLEGRAGEGGKLEIGPDSSSKLSRFHLDSRIPA